jgi:hypothetical protein
VTGADRRSRRQSRAVSSTVTDPCARCAGPHDGPGKDDGPGPGLGELILTGMHERGWSYSDLERASDRALTRGRWQQLGSGVPQRKFPEPGSLTVIAQVLEVDMTTVVLAAARSLGLEVGRRGAELAHLLPVHTDRISERMRDAILTLIRSAVAEASDDHDLEVSRSGSLRAG